MSQKRTRLEAELAKIRQAIAAQKALRGLLPDEQLETTLASLRQKATSLQAELSGEGAIAQGERATAASAIGDDSIAIGRAERVTITRDASQSAGDHSAVTKCGLPVAQVDAGQDRWAGGRRCRGGPPGVGEGRAVAVGGCSMRIVGVWGGNVGSNSTGVAVASGVGVSGGRLLSTE